MAVQLISHLAGLDTHYDLATQRIEAPAGVDSQPVSINKT
jgi:hypothetical protein